MNNLSTTIAELKTFIGETFNYTTPKGTTYKLRISDVTPKGVRAFDPESGAAATLPIERVSEILRLSYIKTA